MVFDNLYVGEVRNLIVIQRQIQLPVFIQQRFDWRTMRKLSHTIRDGRQRHWAGESEKTAEHISTAEISE